MSQPQIVSVVQLRMISQKIKKQKKQTLESEVTGRKSTLNSTCSLNMIDYIRET